MTLFEKLQLKVNKASKIGFSRGSSESSHDSGYVSFGTSLERDDDQNSMSSSSSKHPTERLKMDPHLEPVDELQSPKHHDQQKATLDSTTAEKRPEEQPEDAVIDSSMHRAARGIVCDFRRNFGTQIARHLNSRPGRNSHAIAIFPAVSCGKGGSNNKLTVEIIIQCHPLAESHIKQFLKEKRPAIDSFIVYSQVRNLGSTMLSVDVSIVGREITFLAQFPVYTRPYQSRAQRSALPGNLVTIDLGKGNSVASSLGGFVTITPKREKDASWFGLTTWHGIEDKSDGDLDMESNPLALIIDILRSLDNWTTRIAAKSQLKEQTSHDDKILDLVEKCKDCCKTYARAQCLQSNIGNGTDQGSLAVLKTVHEWLKYDFPTEQHETFLIHATRTLSLASKVEDNKEDTKLEGKQKASEPAQQIGHVTLGSGSLLNWEDDVLEYIDTETVDEGTLDWALLDLFKDRSECYPFSEYRNDVFEPSDPSIDIDETPKVILLNRVKGYPEAQISPQLAFLSFPPSMELVELLTFRLNGSEVLTPGDSGSWVISVDVSGKKIVHGQVVAVNSLGDGLLIPMSSIVADIKDKLSPIFEPRPIQVKTHVPLDAVNLEDMADFIREWAVPRMSQEEQVLAFRFMKLGLDAAANLWKENYRKVTFRTYFATRTTQQWATMDKELQKEVKDWKMHLQSWEANQRIGPLLSTDWVNERVGKRHLWHKRAIDLESKYLQDSSVRGLEVSGHTVEIPVLQTRRASWVSAGRRYHCHDDTWREPEVGPGCPIARDRSANPTAAAEQEATDPCGPPRAALAQDRH
ncbi:hypothetical protein QBC38DRAFT_172065 [Podospora fimiseda]|uniref:Uncharacterized protein n=1 Tax=Podospora fimiseda TaxID=252190 RepID=A0AAN7BED3_9PEZI|nr:hypothetical protein QBC38DRAFT_172065 [Podospora fimiseda]